MVNRNRTIGNEVADILRKSCYLATALVLIYGLLLTTGRILTAFPNQLETLVNEALEPQGIMVEGIRSGWRLSNPVIQANRIHLPQGTLENTLLEIAMVESLIRFQFVARRLLIEDLNLKLELEEEAAELNIAKLIEQIEAGFEWVRHTDQINVKGTINLNRQEMSQSWFTRLHAVNHRGIHRYRAELQQLESEKSGAVDFVAEAVDTLLDLRTGDFQMKLVVSDVPIDLPLLTGSASSPQFTVDGNTELTIYHGLTQGKLTINASNDRDSQSQLALHGTIRGDSGGTLRYEIDSPSLKTSNSTTELPAIRMAVDDSSINGTATPTQLREVLVAITDFINSGNEPINWVRAIDLRATLSDLEFVVDESGIHWAANLRSLTGNQFKNVPAAFLSQASLYGNLQQFAYEINNAHGSLFFGSYFDTAWNFATVSGNGLVDIRRGEVGLVFNDFALSADITESPSSLVDGGDFHRLFNQTDDPSQFNELIQEPVNAHVRGTLHQKFGGDPNYRIALLVESESSLVPSQQVIDYVPTAVVANLSTWQEEYVDEASFYGTQIAYLTYRDGVISALTRDMLLKGRFTNGTVTYDKAWPALENLSGTWQVNNDQVQIQAERATTQNTELTGALATFPLHSEDSFNIKFEATTSTDELLKFVQDSELKDWLPPIESSWHGDGEIAVSGYLNFPLQRADNNETSDAIGGDHQIRFELMDVSLTMPNLAIEMSELNGSAGWRSPHFVETNLESGRFFNRPMTGSIESTIRDSMPAIEFHASSEVSLDNAAQIAGLEASNLGSGETAFHANLVIFPDVDRAEELFVATDLVGMELDLLEPFRQDSSTPYPIAFQVAMGGKQKQLTIQSQDVNGWLTLQDESGDVLEGAIALGQPATLPSRIPRKVHVSGSMESWSYANQDESLLDADFVFTNLEVENISAFDTQFSDVRINGSYTVDTFDLAITSDEFNGTLVSQGDGFYTEINANRLLWSLNEEGSENQLNLDTLRSLNPLKISIQELRLKPVDEPSQNWGEWEFTVTPRSYGIEISDLSARTRGLEVNSEEALEWNLDSNKTAFSGRIHGEDLGNILQGWGFDASAESESFDIDLDINWVGSPLDLDIERTSGRIRANAESGRFINVDQGGDVLRLVSLLNFSKILNRLTLDFKDVTQAGLHFDTASAGIQLEDGLMTFIDPLTIEGPSARLDLSGIVDTRSGILDSDLQVRIPLHKGLQTAATTLAAINPPATVSLLLGTWLISEPIKALLTANYEITGTLDNPIITRVNTASIQSNAN